MKKYLVFMLLAIAAVTMFVSCSNDASDKIEEVTYENIKGTWKQENNNVNAKIIFTDNGTSKRIEAEEIKGEDETTVFLYYYAISDGVITMKFDESYSDIYEYEAFLKGGKLVMKYKSGKQLFSYYDKTTEFTFSKVN